MDKPISVNTENALIDCIFLERECPANSIKKNRERLFKKKFVEKFPDGILTLTGNDGILIQIGKQLAVNYFFWLEKYGFSEMSYLSSTVSGLLIIGDGSSEEARMVELSPRIVERYINLYPPVLPPIEDDNHLLLIENIHVVMIIVSEKVVKDIVLKFKKTDD